MRTNALAIAAVVALAVPTTQAQVAPNTPPAPTVKEAIYQASNALGMLRSNQEVDLLSTVEFWGTGTMTTVAQGGKPGPAFKVTSYHGSMGYDDPPIGGMRVDVTRTNADGPAQAPQRQIQAVSGKQAWNELTPGMNATPAPGAEKDRLLLLWMTPFGAIKAAAQAAANVKVTIEGGATVLTFPVANLPSTAPIAGTVLKVTLNDERLPAKVEARVGDAVVETDYSGYGDLNDPDFPADIFFPRRFVQKQGGVSTLDLTISRTNTYNPYNIFPTPENIRPAAGATP